VILGTPLRTVVEAVNQTELVFMGITIPIQRLSSIHNSPPILWKFFRRVERCRRWPTALLLVPLKLRQLPHLIRSRHMKVKEEVIESAAAMEQRNR
jgi:hypothetical protein